MADLRAVAVRTACPYCGVGCGVLASPGEMGTVDITGDPDHPANFGRLCSKGSALGETLSHDDRLLSPLVHGAPASWEAALDLAAGRFAETIAEHGPDSVAFYVSGQLLTEDYYVANKLMKGFIGSANIDTNSRLCMASSVAGHKRAFGADVVPGTYEDLDEADLVILVGSNLAWCHPVLFQRLVAARQRRSTKVIVVDPRRTATCEIADLHLALNPGTDVALFNGLLTSIAGANALDLAYVQNHTAGARDAMTAARVMSLAEIAQTTGLSQLALQAFFDLFTNTRRVVTVYSQGVNQSTAGTDKVNAIINCHLATGRIGRPGMGPFSVTGQPNAMGGREVGGLATMLAAHMELGDANHRQLVQSFWQSPRIADRPGLKAVDMFRACADGRIRAIWILSTNPVASMPDANALRAALQACPFVVVSDIERYTDTTALAHILLPAIGWGEKNGTVTNSERRISRQRAFMAGPTMARADWWQICEVAKRMGFGSAFAYATAAEIFAEHAALSAHMNNGTRAFDIGAYAEIDADAYDALQPFQWPQPRGRPAQQTRFFANGNYVTADQRARLIPTPYRRPASTVSSDFPLALNTGRIRDQWHTMTRSARSARLMTHLAEPFLEINPNDAAELAIAPADLVIVESANGRAVLRALVTTRVQRGAVFAPIHWTDQVASNARVDTLVAGHVDPLSGQPELKYTPVRVGRFAAAWYGFGLSIDEPVDRSHAFRSHEHCAHEYWAIARTKAGWRAESAGRAEQPGWDAIFRAQVSAETAEVVAYHDPRKRAYRFAAFVDNRLTAALFIAAEPVAVPRAALAEQLGERFAPGADRHRLLASRVASDGLDPGPTVCACFGIGRNQIIDAIVQRRCGTVDAVGRATQAGTNCGSCRPEIGGLLDATRLAKAG